MEVLLLYGKKPSRNGLDLVEAAIRLGHDVTQGSIMDMSSEVSSSGSQFWLNGQDLTGTDVCFLRSFGPGSCEQLTRRISMVEHLELSGIRVVNPGYPFRRARDKYATQYVLQKAGLPVATTYTTENMERAFRRSIEMQECVYKPILGSMGKGSLKFDNPDIAYNAWKMLSRLGQPLIVQEYIHNPGRDIRVFVVGEEAIGTVYKYGGPGQWKTNVAQGGRMVEGKIPHDVVELGLKATKTIGLDYAGVDIIESDRGPIILEVNGAPGWQALKKATNIDVAERIIRYITE